MASSGTPIDDERALLAGLINQLSQRAPRSWRFESRELEGASYPGTRPDAILGIIAPDGRRTEIGVEVKLSLYPRDVYAMSSQLGGIWPSDTRPGGRLALPPSSVASSS